MKITIALLSLLLFVPNPLAGQANPPAMATAKKVPQSAPVKKAKPPGTGELTGFVFAITKAGDLKPARLAHIVLLYVHRNGLRPDEEFGPSVGWKYTTASLDASLNVAKKETEGLRSDSTPLSDEQICLETIKEDIAAVASTVEWAATENLLNQVKSTEADEEGHFKLSGVPPGDYTLAASGQAGMNTAYWEQDDVVITSGQTTSVKLSSPEQACLLAP